MKIFTHWLGDGGAEAQSLREMTRRFMQMLEDGRHIFDASSNALLGGTDPEVIREDLFGTDQRINRTEQELRRAIVVHGSVYGSQTFPGLLVLMSLGKDAERIGDYAKNLFDLAVHRPDLGSAEEVEEMVTLKDEISRALVRARNLFEAEDDEGARAFLTDVDALADRCDGAIESLLKRQGENCAAPALAHRYFKRVVSHAGNVVTSLIMPVHKLDFFDEPDRPAH